MATTDHTGAVTARYAYDPFGKRRFTNGSYDAFGTLVVDWTSNTNAGTDRGYTGHEHPDDVGLVHMNGRIFDLTLGVFLQGDPFIQDPGNLQNYNRYGYCFNNPLACTDPSGYFGFGHLLVLVYMAWVADQMPEFRPYVAIFAAVVLGPAGGAFEGGAAAYGMSQAATAGFVSGAIATGNLQGALQGAFTAAMFNGAGNLIGGGDFFTGAGASAGTAWTNPLAGIALHAVVGCVTSAAGGGKCGPGALSAAFAKGFSGEIMSKTGDAGVIASAVIGGTASVLGGGKFASGAMSGAFGYLFNDTAHPRGGSMQCSSDARLCTTSIYEERFTYTGKMSVDWRPIDWDDPALMKTFSVDLMSLMPKVAAKIPGFELEIESATQLGEILHEVRVDRQYYSVKIVDQVEVSRTPTEYVLGNMTRWVSAPGTRDLTSRTQIQSCISVICADWRK